MRVSCLTGNTTSLWGMGQCTKQVVRVESALPVHSAIAEGGLTFTCWTRSCTSVWVAKGWKSERESDGALLFCTEIEAATSVEIPTSEMRKVRLQKTRCSAGSG